MSTDSSPSYPFPIRKTGGNGHSVSVYHTRECRSVKAMHGFRECSPQDTDRLDECQLCKGTVDWTHDSGRYTPPEFDPSKKPVLTECPYPDCSGDVQQGFTPSQSPQCRACGRRPDYA